MLVVLLTSGCAVRLHTPVADNKDARLAAAQEQLVHLTDPIDKSRTYTSIADMELNLAVDAAQAGDLGKMTALLQDYDSAIQGSRDSLIQSPRKLKASPYRDFEIALRTQLRILKSLSNSLTFDQREPVTATIEKAAAIREQIFRLLFPKVALAR